MGYGISDRRTAVTLFEWTVHGFESDQKIDEICKLSDAKSRSVVVRMSGEGSRRPTEPRGRDGFDPSPVRSGPTRPSARRFDLHETPCATASRNGRRPGGPRRRGHSGRVRISPARDEAACGRPARLPRRRRTLYRRRSPRLVRARAFRSEANSAAIAAAAPEGMGCHYGRLEKANLSNPLTFLGMFFLPGWHERGPPAFGASPEKSKSFK